MTTVLQVATPQGDSGKILTSAGDYLFRYHEDAKAQAAISLLKNKSVPFSNNKGVPAYLASTMSCAGLGGGAGIAPDALRVVGGG